LEKGVDINKEVEHEGYTAVPLEFMLLFNKNPLELVKLFLEHGADIKKVHIRPIINSCVYGGTGTASILKLLLENGLDPNDTSLKSYDGKSFIFQICSAENVTDRYRKLELLLEHGANPNDTWNGYSLLPYVILHNEPLLAELIIRYGADVNTPPFSYTDNPLKQAILKHNSSLIDLLIKKGADINSKESTLQTPLMKAIQSKIDYWTLLGFLEKGADVNAKDKTKRTPLDYAITYLDDPEEIVELLLDYGANPNEMKTQSPTGNKTVDDLLQKYIDKMNSKKEESISIKRIFRR
jgi:ankyrin repeat protein